MYDLIVIGGGLGGYGAAIRAAKKNKKILLIEKNKIGGTCLNIGCIPTKSLLYSSNLYDKINNLKEFGLTAENVDYDWGKIIERKNQIINRLVKGVEFLLKKNNIEIIKGTASFKNEKTIKVKNRSFKGKNIIIATGSTPVSPPIEYDKNNEKIMFSNKIFELEKPPESITIIGAGAIGVEIASVFKSFNKQVHLIEIMDEILPGSDKFIINKLNSILKKKGIYIHTSTKVKKLSEKNNKIKIFAKNNSEQISLDTNIVLISTGRQGFTKSLGLENIDIYPDKKGFLKTNSNFKIKDGIYAVGDVRGGKLLAHKALHEGIYAADNIFEKKDLSINEDNVPNVVYTEPEYASVGLTEKQAKNMYENIKVGKFPLQANGRALIMGETEGICKTIFAQNKIVGAHILAPHAGDMIPVLENMIKNKEDFKKAESLIFPHPTVCESIGESILDSFNQAIHKL